MGQKVSAAELREHKRQYEDAAGITGTVQCPGCPEMSRVDPQRWDGMCESHWFQSSTSMFNTGC